MYIVFLRPGFHLLMSRLLLVLLIRCCARNILRVYTDDMRPSMRHYDAVLGVCLFGSSRVVFMFLISQSRIFSFIFRNLDRVIARATFI